MAEFPAQTITLPSKGYFYTKDHPLKNGEVELKYPTAKEEDILTDRNLIRKGIVIDKFIESILVTSVNMDDILLGDINGIMVASRILAYGPEYEVKIKCPSCNEESNIKTDLTELKSRDIDFEQYDQNQEEFDYELPIMKTKVKFRLLTHKDERNIRAELDSLKKLGRKGSKELTTRLAYVLTEIDGERDITKIRKFIEEQLLAQDSRNLREHIATINPGIDMKFEFECKHCGYQEVMTLPMGVGFFWPSGRV